jgi:hypothetical protein
MSIPRFIYMKSDGLTSSTQIALKPVPNMDELWTSFLIPFLIKKRENTPHTQFLHEEMIDYHECKFIRKVKFVYDESEASRQLFLQLFQFENPELSILVALVPITTPVEEGSEEVVPRLVEMVTNKSISPYELYFDEPSKALRPFYNFKYLYITQKQDRSVEQIFIKPVSEEGVDVLHQIWDNMQTYYDRAQTEGAPFESHELVDHVDCGKIARLFFHYEKTPASLEMLYHILETRRESTNYTIRIVLVPKTPGSEAVLRSMNATADLHYPCLINAATRSEQALPLPTELDSFSNIHRILTLRPLRSLMQSLFF